MASDAECDDSAHPTLFGGPSLSRPADKKHHPMSSSYGGVDYKRPQIVRGQRSGGQRSAHQVDVEVPGVLRRGNGDIKAVTSSKVDGQGKRLRPLPVIKNSHTPFNKLINY